MAELEVKSLGMPGLPRAIIPHPLADRTPEQLSALAEAALPEIERALEIRPAVAAQA